MEMTALVVAGQWEMWHPIIFF